MYITAHRVVSTTTQEEGINAFYHRHGEHWIGYDADLKETPSTLIAKKRELPDGINRIRSYLDVVAMDGASPRELMADYESVVLGATPSQFPYECRGTSSLIKMGVERSLAASWQAEAQLLFYACLEVWRRPAGNSIQNTKVSPSP